MRVTISSPMIEAVGLHKSFGTTHALRSLDLSAAEGTILGVLGPNGAGKTTAVRILTTLTCPDAGTATVAGIDVLRQPGEARSRIGVAGQYASLDELMTLVIDTVRSLTLTGQAGNAVLPAIVWSLGALVIFFPLGLWLYSRRTTQ